MKVAVLYSGLVRTLPEVITTHKARLLNRYDCDTFFHFWDVINKNKGWGGIVQLEDSRLSEEYKQEVVNLLSPKKYFFEDISLKYTDLKSISDKFDNSLSSYNPRNVVNMYYSIKETFRLFEEYKTQTNSHYDVVVRIRADLKFLSDMNVYITEDNVLVIPNIYHYGGVNDQLSFGNFHTMKTFSNLFDTISTLNRLHPETTLSNYLHRNNIRSEQFPISYEIVRPI